MVEKLFKYKIAGKLFGPVSLEKLILMHHQKELGDNVEVIPVDSEKNRTILLGVLIKALREKYSNSKKNQTLKEFADQVGAPLNMLMMHAKNAGLNYESSDSIVYEEHKKILLEYLKKLSKKNKKQHKKSFTKPRKKRFRLSYLTWPSLLFLLVVSLIDIDNIKVKKIIETQSIEKNIHNKKNEITVIERDLEEGYRSDYDSDGCPYSSDLFPYDPDECYDNDGDGIGNNADSDDDNDGVEDVFDAFPYDASEWTDTDSDGVGNNADSDDDNNGVPDVIDSLEIEFNKVSREKRKKVQYALLNKGYYQGKIDAVWGKGTKDALIQYADKNKIIYTLELIMNSLLKDLTIPPHIYLEGYPQPTEIVTKHTYHKGGWSTRYPFKIDTSGEKSYFVKLVDKQNGTDAMTILIKKGEKFNGKAPAGHFGLRYASGDYWYGEELLFGPDTQYKESLSGLHFYTSGNSLNGHTLKLYQVINGNLKTKKISGANF